MFEAIRRWFRRLFSAKPVLCESPVRIPDQVWGFPRLAASDAVRVSAGMRIRVCLVDQSNARLAMEGRQFHPVMEWYSDTCEPGGADPGLRPPAAGEWFVLIFLGQIRVSARSAQGAPVVNMKELP